MRYPFCKVIKPIMNVLSNKCNKINPMYFRNISSNKSNGIFQIEYNPCNKFIHFEVFVIFLRIIRYEILIFSHPSPINTVDSQCNLTNMFYNPILPIISFIINQCLSGGYFDAVSHGFLHRVHPLLHFPSSHRTTLQIQTFSLVRYHCQSRCFFLVQLQIY
jgi:hypothetical protein